MLRTIKSPYAGIRLVPGKVSYSGGTPSVSLYKGNFGATVTDTGTGVVGLTLKDPGAAVLGGWATAVTDKYSASVTTLSLTSVVISASDDSGSPADTDIFFVLAVCDQRALIYDHFNLRAVTAAMADSEILAVEVDTSGSGAFLNSHPHSRDATLTRNGTGDVTVSISKPFQIAPVVIARATETGNNATVSSTAVNSFRVKLWDATSSSAAVDGTCTVLVFGQRSKHQGGHLRRSIKNSRPKPYLFPFKIAYAGGTSGTLAQGSEVLSLGSVSVGTFPLTFVKAFKTKPIVISGSSLAARLNATTARSTTAATIQQLSAAGAASTTASTIYGLVLGWMDDVIEPRF